MTSQPIAQCYWVLPGKFLVGEYPRNKDKNFSISKIRSLIEAGVSAFIDITEKDEGLAPYTELIGVAPHERFPIPDFSIPAFPEVTMAALDAIDYHIGQGRVVYLHWWAAGRSG